MEFIKRMKKREFIEMSLKALAALLALFLAVILMEGMIYGIQLNALKTKATNSTAISNSTIAYCIPEEDDKYFVVYYNADEDKDTYDWSAVKNEYKTKDECEALSVKEVVFRAPNAFEFSITGIHFVIIAVVTVALAGFFAYRFVRLAKEYKRIEENFVKNGTIEINA